MNWFIINTIQYYSSSSSSSSGGGRWFHRRSSRGLSIEIGLIVGAFIRCKWFYWWWTRWSVRILVPVRMRWLSFLKNSNKHCDFSNNKMVFVALNITPIGSLGSSMFFVIINFASLCGVRVVFPYCFIISWGLYGKETVNIHFTIKLLLMNNIYTNVVMFLKNTIINHSH